MANALKRDLSLLDIFCLAAGTMISSGIFILPGLAYSQAGPLVFISYFVAGILALPGMMTGVILGGISPELAIKYQIMIMI